MKQNTLIGILAILLAPMSGIGIDIFIPSLPAIAQHFRAPETAVQLSVGIYLIGYATLQLLWGTLSDRFGRRPLLIIGLSGILITCILITFSINIFMLLLLRYIQGICVGPCGVLPRALVADTMTGIELESYSHNLTTAWALGPIIAPFIGGYLQNFFGWRGSFIFLAIYCVVLLFLVMRFLPETLPQRLPLSLQAIKISYQQILGNSLFIGTAIIMACTWGFMTIFNAEGPFLIQTVLGYTAIEFGQTALLLGIAWFLGNVINRILHRYFESRQITQTILIFLILISLLQVFLAFNFTNLAALLIPVIFIFICASMVFANSFALCISLIGNHGGTASAVMGMITIAGAGLLSALASFFETSSLLPLAIIYFTLSLFCFFFVKIFLSR